MESGKAKREQNLNLPSEPGWLFLSAQAPRLVAGRTPPGASASNEEPAREQSHIHTLQVSKDNAPLPASPGYFQLKKLQCLKDAEHLYICKNIQAIFCAAATLSFHFFISKHCFSTRYSPAFGEDNPPAGQEQFKRAYRTAGR